MNSVTFVIESIEKDGFTTFARQTRLALGYSPAVEAGQEVVSKNFDGASIIEIAYNLSDNIAPFLTGLAAYIVAKRGEIKVKTGNKEYHFKNIKKSDVFEIIDKIKDAEGDDRK